MSSCIAADASLSSAKPAWRAVYALALGVFGLIVAEFLPASLLTPMASSLGVSEGMAGQAVTATALVALVTGLLIATATRNIDRRWVLMFFSILQIVSSLMVAFADSLAFLLLGRLLLGIAIGGFWAMSTATAMRLVPAAHVPKALAIIFSAVSVATVVAAPLGSYLGELPSGATCLFSVRYPACWRCSGSCGCCPPCARRASGPSPRCSGCCAAPVCWAACWRRS
ncbi:putative inner membrane transport protein [Klebsiella pneumoniae]|nr:putative inner membrane transport protein [Klebsiella pneumoniae]